MFTRRRRLYRFLPGVLLIAAASAASSGCMQRKLKPLNPCLVSGVAEQVEVSGIDKVDLMFVVDNSRSMLDEQEKLAREFPALIRTLTTGERDGGESFPPAEDLHLAVVTTDMGVPGLPSPFPESFLCNENNFMGENGVMRAQSAAIEGECAGVTLPNNANFISYSAEDPTLNAQEATRLFGCVAQVGAEGCGYEMQLDAVLKALWPRDAALENQLVQAANSNFLPPRFLTNTPGDPTNPDALGHGGDPGFPAANAGFLRNDAAAGLSLLAVILVTDEDDCSSQDVWHLQYRGAPGTPPDLAAQGDNLRCFRNKDHLQPTQRYVDGLKALRPGNENLVIFGAIVGVPQDLVTSQIVDGVDLSNEGMRNQFYQGILSDPRMQETVNDEGDNLEVACRAADDPDLEGGARPPIRILEVVRGFGENGVVQSICEDTFAPAIDSIIDVIADQLGDVCLPRQLVRQSDGLVGCKVVWELPGQGDVIAPGAPTDCDQESYLSVPVNSAQYASDGGQRCEVVQLPVFGDQVPMGDGWYYDDFSEEIDKCQGLSKQRVAFTNSAVPPNGITVQLECLNETQRVPQTRTDLDAAHYAREGTEPPSIGSPCENDDAQCVLMLGGGGVSQEMFCHREQNVCVLECSSDADCPPAWVCDPRGDQAIRAGGEGSARRICVNPTCGTD